MTGHIHAEREAGTAQGVLIVAAGAMPVMGVVLLAPVAVQMQKALAAASGGSAQIGAIALTAPALAIALLAPFGGYLVDRIGRRVMLIGSLFLYAFLGMLPLALENPYAIVGARFALGIAEAVIMAANFALLSSYFSGAARDRWLAYNGAVVSLAATAFYMIGGFLGEFSWKAPFLVYGAALPIALLTYWKIFEPSRHDVANITARADRSHAWKDFYSKILAILGLALIGSVFFYIVPLQLGRFLAERGITSPSEIGMWIAIAGVSNPIGAFMFRFLRGYPTGYLLAATSIIAGVGLAIAGVAESPTGLIIGAFVNQFGCGLFVPSAVAAVMRRAPADRRGTAGGSFYMAFFIGQFLSPLVVLQVVMSWSIGSALVVLAVANAIFGLICYVAGAATGLNRKVENA